MTDLPFLAPFQREDRPAMASVAHDVALHALAVGRVGVDLLTEVYMAGAYHAIATLARRTSPTDARQQEGKT